MWYIARSSIVFDASITKEDSITRDSAIFLIRYQKVSILVCDDFFGRILSDRKYRRTSPVFGNGIQINHAWFPTTVEWAARSLDRPFWRSVPPGPPWLRGQEKHCPRTIRNGLICSILNNYFNILLLEDFGRSALQAETKGIFKMMVLIFVNSLAFLLQKVFQ